MVIKLTGAKSDWGIVLFSVAWLASIGLLPYVAVVLMPALVLYRYRPGSEFPWVVRATFVAFAAVLILIRVAIFNNLRMDLPVLDRALIL